jgi:hypothetical protein
VITELKYVQVLRQLIFSLPSRWQFKLLAFMLKQMPDKLIESAHGQRSVKRLRSLAPM